MKCAVVSAIVLGCFFTESSFGWNVGKALEKAGQRVRREVVRTARRVGGELEGAGQRVRNEAERLGSRVEREVNRTLPRLEGFFRQAGKDTERCAQNARDWIYEQFRGSDSGELVESQELQELNGLLDRGDELKGLKEGCLREMNYSEGYDARQEAFRKFDECSRRLEELQAQIAEKIRMISGNGLLAGGQALGAAPLGERDPEEQLSGSLSLGDEDLE